MQPADSMVQRIEPGSFELSHHVYPRVVNAHLHPLVQFFFSLGNRRIAERYCHLHPEVNPQAVQRILKNKVCYFRWGGADLIHVTNESGQRSMAVIECNSSPSGHKSVPMINEHNEHGGFRKTLQLSLLPHLRRRSQNGGVAVLFDKNHMEASGYAATLAELLQEPVYLVPCFQSAENPNHRFDEQGVLHILDSGQWHPIRGALRYVTQKPWTRIPPITRTIILNPVLVCLAGGRNKALAAKAYEMLNAELSSDGLGILAPETIWDVAKDTVPMWVDRMGGVAVVKVPYSNAGQGVYTITNQKELDAFLDIDHRYKRFIVQSLIGNKSWSSKLRMGRLYHVGTVPDKKGNIFAADLRFMVATGPEGAQPVALYARRARLPLSASLDSTTDSWDMLGTNLSVKLGQDRWDSQTNRLLLMDSRDFNRLGLGLDDLIEAYIQSVLAVRAIDNMAKKLVTQKGKFRKRLFRGLVPDKGLWEEICP